MPQQTSLINVILLAAGGFFMFVCMDSTAKYLGTVMPITQAIWGRFFFQAEDGIRDDLVTGVQTCALPISKRP